MFAIVLALAIGEAFKQFVSDKAEKPEDRHIHWNRIFALIAFVTLVVPFSHGMARYFFETYREPYKLRSYSPFLLIDSVVFSIEGVLFFILSRALPLVQWRRFYSTVIVLLILDSLWALIVFFHPGSVMWPWVIDNIVVIALLAAILLLFKDETASKKGAILCMAIIIVRTIVDYYVNWSFYFPPQTPNP